MQKILPTSELNNFLDTLMKKFELIAPIKHDNVTKFEIIQNLNDIYLDSITEVPAKNFFMPESEELFKFKDKKIIEAKNPEKKRVIFGLRKCDLNSLKILDNVMHDSGYLEKRKNTILIGIHCKNPDDYCFCNSMKLEDYYDLFFYEFDNKYYVSVGSKKGLKIVKDLKDAKREIKIPNPKNKKALKTLDIERHYKNKIWESDAEKCLSCGVCTAYCPTCNCFNIEDNLNMNLNQGERIREQASCQLKSFSRLAGNKIIRDSRLSRFKHFVFHKIVYYRKKFKRPMCVGCGRCLRVCPPKIDWVDTINMLNDSGVMKK
ncbi:MAG: 4Fe-4S dicluster domain-containing protein [Nanoarchaeota archaeon]